MATRSSSSHRSSSAALLGPTAPRLRFPTMLHGNGAGPIGSTPPSHTYAPPDAAADPGNQTNVRRSALLDELGAFIESRLQHHKSAADLPRRAAVAESEDYCEPILHRGFNSSRHSSSGRGDRGKEKSTSTSHNTAARGASPLDTFCTVPLPADLAANTCEVPTATSAGDGQATPREEANTLQRALLAPSASPPEAVRVAQRSATRQSESTTHSRSRPAPTRSPSPEDPSLQMLPPPPAQRQATAHLASPMLTPTRLAKPLGSSSEESLQPPPQSGSRLLDEVFALRRENETLRSEANRNQQEAEVLAAAVGRLETVATEQRESIETYETTIAELREQLQVTDSARGTAADDAAAARDLYEALLVRHEEICEETSVTERELRAQLEDARDDLRGSLDMAQAEAGTNQRLLDVMSAELTLLRQQQQMHTSKPATFSSVEERDIDGDVPATTPSSRPISPAVEVVEIGVGPDVVEAAKTTAEAATTPLRRGSDVISVNGGEVIHCSPIPASDHASSPAHDGPPDVRAAASSSPPLASVTNEEEPASPLAAATTDDLSALTPDGTQLSGFGSPVPASLLSNDGSVLLGSAILRTLVNHKGVQTALAMHADASVGVDTVTPALRSIAEGRATSEDVSGTPIRGSGGGVDADVFAALALLTPAGKQQQQISPLSPEACGGDDDASVVVSRVPAEDPQLQEAAPSSDVTLAKQLKTARVALSDTKRRLGEATGQWNRWVEQCNKAKVVLIAERQAKEAADAHAATLQSECEHLRARVESLEAELQKQRQGAGAHTQDELNAAVKRAREEGLTLASEVAEYCMQVLDDVRAGRREL